ncbi:MAG: hypothetical protein AAGP08_09005 [Pseudomonadota bacterium]
MIRTFLIASICALALPSFALAEEVELRLQPSALSFKGGASYTNAALKITGPDDFEAEETSSRGLPVFRVTGGRFIDGVYYFSLSAATDEEVAIKRPIDNGRGDSARDSIQKPFHMDGAFRIRRGLIEPLEAGGTQDEVSDG